MEPAVSRAEQAPNGASVPSRLVTAGVAEGLMVTRANLLDLKILQVAAKARSSATASSGPTSCLCAVVPRPSGSDFSAACSGRKCFEMDSALAAELLSRIKDFGHQFVLGRHPWIVNVMFDVEILS
jgi:hypothetical protein